MKEQFRIRFPVPMLKTLAGEYSYAEDDGVIAIGNRARDRGYLTGDEFREIGDWKTTRQRTARARNSDAEVEEITRIALSSPAERVRVGVLLCMDGVSWPTASVILHLCHRDPYPILDVRAIWSLGIDRVPSYGFRFWIGYVEACRALAERSGLDMRTVDRALWQYSKDHQGTL